MSADNTARMQRDEILRKHAFKPGQSGNPAGRPKGARSKLSEDFFKALADDFAQHGADTIVKMRTERPGEYAKMIATLQTKELSGPDGGPIDVATALDQLSDA